MTETSPYVRIELESSDMSQQFVDDLVLDCLERLELTLAEDQRQPDVAYDLIAKTRRLERVRPEIITRLDPNGILKRASDRLSQGWRVLLDAALTVPQPEGWLRDAEEMAGTGQGLLDTVDLAAWERQLIDDFDDAQLLASLCEEKAIEHAELSRKLQSCRQWIETHDYEFLDAGLYVQALGHAMRPGLDQYSPILTATAELYEVLLDGQVASFTEMLDAADDLVDAFDEQPQQSSFVLRPNAFRAAASTATAALPAHECAWIRPDGAAKAILLLPSAELLHDSTLVTVTFRFLDASERDQLVGKVVVLAGITTEVATDYTAKFDAGGLASKDLCTPLQVDHANWPSLPPRAIHAKNFA